MARLATGGDELEVLEDASRYDISGLRRRIAARRRVTRREEQEAFGDQHVVIQAGLDDTRWEMWGRLNGLDGAVVDRALAERADAMPSTLPDGTPLPVSPPGFGPRGDLARRSRPGEP